MLRIANPSTSVRLRDAPPVFQSPGGEIGRHKGFKIPRLMAVRGQVPPRAPWKKVQVKQSSMSMSLTAERRFFCA